MKVQPMFAEDFPSRPHLGGVAMWRCHRHTADLGLHQKPTFPSLSLRVPLALPSFLPKEKEVEAIARRLWG